MAFGEFNLFRSGGGGSALEGALVISTLILVAALTFAAPTPALAATYSGALKAVEAASLDTAGGNVVNITFNDGVRGRITFLDDGIFRYSVDPTGEFSEYATPRKPEHVAKIQAQPDSSDVYGHPQASVSESDGKIVIASGTTSIEFDKASAKMTVKRDGRVVMEERSPLDIGDSATTQTLVRHDGEDFFGGGTQNGRFIHTGTTIDISNESNWVDGGVASPSPFYWSDAGYGVLRNTFQDGSYDFGATAPDTITTRHDEAKLDAYYFVADAASGATTASVAQDLLKGYFKVTGNPVLLPEYAFYVGHLNAWNRDMWSGAAMSGYKKWQIKGGADSSDANAGDIKYESGGTGVEMQGNSLVETLNGTGPTVGTENIPAGVTYSRDFSARARLDSYVANDMPLGYFLPNDGYGAGYGQNGYKKTGGVNADGSSTQERLDAVRANVQNLKEFSDYAAEHGVATGLWTQSDLKPTSDPGTEWQLLRDFDQEVTTGGVTTLKTDVAWVGPGYSFALNGTKTAYDTVTDKASKRPNIITLDGWAGTQRYAAIWTGDQSGGNWEYIRFHVPTYIGQSLAGNPNIGSDNDGIFGGNPVIATRDYQWKSFAPLMLDMDGWGSYVKSPQTHGDPYTGISRMYLKLKSQLMPYIYTTAASAANIDTGNGDAGLPTVRAILLSDDSDYAQSTATQYEYTLGEDFLVAPIVQNTRGDDSNGGVGDGNDVRNGIYLPGDANTIWIDYFTGKQYRGGQVLNSFDAPLWKLPVFVKANAIIPMYQPNNNPNDVDRSIRNVEFFATAGENSYTQYEDDGIFIDADLKESNDKEYGTENKVSYGGHVSTTYTSKVDASGKAVFTAEKSQGGYAGYKKDRTTTFIANVSERPTSIVAKNGDEELKEREVDTQAAFDAAVPAEGEAVVFYNERPNLNYGASSAASDAVKAEKFSSQEIPTTPKLYVKFAKTDVQANRQTLELGGFKNDGVLDANVEDASLEAPVLKTPTEEDGDLTPTSFRLSWDKVDGAISYELMIDGALNSVPAGTDEHPVTSFTATDQAYNSTHKVRIRQRTATGFSRWSDEMTVVTLQDPWRNVPQPESVDWKHGDSWGGLANAFDHNRNTMFHSTGDAVGKPMTIDYGRGYQLDRFVYTPRQDGGNGNVSRMKVETSLDGVHWQDHGVAEWDNGNVDDKAVSLKGSFARYLRLTVDGSIGNFFSAGELALYKADGSTPFEIGSIAGDGAVNDTDYQHLSGNCLGRENRAPLDTDWSAHVAAHGADFNLNDAYDVYDMAFTMTKLDGGTTRSGKVGGGIVVVPDKAEVAAGDTVNVDLYADGLVNANAVGALVHFPDDQFEFVGDSLKASPYLAGMENKSKVTTNFEDGNQSVNIAILNRGDKDLYNGSVVLASFKLRAKRDGTVRLPSTAWAVGPTLDFVEAADDGTVTYPDAPQPQSGELAMDDVTTTITNAALPVDDGGNVAKMSQGGSFAPLFDGVEYHDGYAGSGVFEFKWGAETPEVSVPVTLHFDVKQNRALDAVEVVNRKNASGVVGGNGYIKRMRGTILFEDGSSQAFEGGDFDTAQPVYTLVPSAENAAKKADRVDVEVLETNGGPHLLTISEVNFTYTDRVASVESVELGENATSMFVGELAKVRADVMPASLGYNQLKVESSNPEVASIVTKQVGENVVSFVRANSAGKATITVKSALDESKSASYELTVREGVNASELDAALAEARSYLKDSYEQDSYAKLAAAMKAGEDLLRGGDYSSDQVARAAIDIRTAIKGLVPRAIDEGELINTEENKDAVSVVDFSSQCEPADLEDGLATNVLDYQDDTYWHSNYVTSLGMPQHLSFDLGGAYDLSGVKFLARQGGTNGDVFEAAVYVADTAEGLATAPRIGVFKFKNNGTVLDGRDTFKEMPFGATGRFVKLEVLHAGGAATDQYASLSEVRFYGTRHEDEAGADMSRLRELVDKIGSERLGADDFTTETWTKLELVLADARRTLAEGTATQAEVDSQLAALQKAYDGLAKVAAPPVEKPDDTDQGSTGSTQQPGGGTGSQGSTGSTQQPGGGMGGTSQNSAQQPGDTGQSGADNGNAGAQQPGSGNQGDTGSGSGRGGKAVPATGDAIAGIMPVAAAAAGLALCGLALMRGRKKEGQR